MFDAQKYGASSERVFVVEERETPLVTNLSAKRNELRKLLLVGCVRRSYLLGQTGKQPRRAPARQSGHKTLDTTSCGRFVFGHSILYPSRVIHKLSTKLSTDERVDALHLPGMVPNVETCKPLKSGGWDFLKTKQLFVKNVVGTRNRSSSRNTGKTFYKTLNHAQYTPTVRAHVYSAVPCDHTYVVTCGNV